MFLLSYWLAIRKFLWLKKLYIEQEKLIAEDRGKKINIRIENIDKISRNYFFYHAGLYCIKLRQKSDFGSELYFTVDILNKKPRPIDHLLAECQKSDGSVSTLKDTILKNQNSK